MGNRLGVGIDLYAKQTLATNYLRSIARRWAWRPAPSFSPALPADQGHAHAMLIVAGLYASGRGVTKDYVKAYTWAYIVASASKVDEDRNGARQLMSLLMKKMTSDEIGRAVVAARAWRAVRAAGAGKAPSIERALERTSPRRLRPHLHPRSCSRRPLSRRRPRSRNRRHPTSRYCRHLPRPRRQFQ